MLHNCEGEYGKYVFSVVMNPEYTGETAYNR